MMPWRAAARSGREFTASIFESVEVAVNGLIVERSVDVVIFRHRFESDQLPQRG